ncbi:Glycoside hydrolase/deacetylase, beta/alpha-barrel domain-containing protein [Rozella allomycis CSF55]|uniref:Glycoside hydrolase/deacetylase, beta/alpha-barrel domain-containing protein n=1 Tax=Rozella allomycis (strain CSF55) TaxID=988480 RepID=A0A075AMJ8_ROZAC|nr:Glycoside hydrolase/deacetylase, beta/alpha-barrel domain-containing protein [Rozella allomycis CSF55]|eukprot:EPZ30851.1 Glycoside hydrolase/deacetylase, beta/alpha-barrel domain-containing protein [Rozella allomycis CSF55]
MLFYILALFIGLSVCDDGNPFQMPPGLTIRKCRQKGTVAITIDDGPKGGMIPVLKLLDKKEYRSHKVTFFVTGKSMDEMGKNDSTFLMKMALRRGHEVGHHSYEHKSYVDLSHDEMKADFLKMDAKLGKIKGTSKIFRPPYGYIKQSVFDFIRSQNYHIIGWTQDTNDWKYYDKDDYVQKVMKELNEEVKKKSIVLMHDNDAKSAEVLEKILKLVDKAGYKSTTVSKCLGIDKEK